MGSFPDTYDDCISSSMDINKTCKNNTIAISYCGQRLPNTVANHVALPVETRQIFST